MMLNYCPFISYNEKYCGAGDKGWMKGSLPAQSDGIVNRYVKGSLNFANIVIASVMNFKDDSFPRQSFKVKKHIGRLS